MVQTVAVSAAQVQIKKVEKINLENENVVLYTPKDIQRIFKCGRKKSYEIMHISGFPLFKINTALYVEKNELEKWIARNKNKNIIT